MKVSSRIDYALSCLLVVAEYYESQQPISVKFIAEKEALEVDYVEQLLIIMKRAGMLKSIRGVKGGYLLAASPAAMTTHDVIKAFDGEALELVCYRKKGRKTPCVHMDSCQVRTFWEGLRKNIENYLESNTIEALLELRRKEKK